MAAPFPSSGEPGLARERLANLPPFVLDHQGVLKLQSHFISVGLKEIGEVCLILIRRATGIRPFGGYYLPWNAVEELLAFCSSHGIAAESIAFLYEANLLELPRDGEPAFLSIHPGYAGPPRPVRRLRQPLGTEPLRQDGA